MNITFYKLSQDGQEEIEVDNWRQAEYGEITCDSPDDLILAGMWLQKHARSIADYTLFEEKSNSPYIEFHKKASPAILRERGLI